MYQHESIVQEGGRGTAFPEYGEEERHAVQETTIEDG
jgi:hypothetical protein